MLIGYARVSTDDQSLDLQRVAPRAEGCERVFEDMAGRADDRSALREALDHLRAGDTLVVWRRDRLGRLTEEPDRSGRGDSSGRLQIRTTGWWTGRGSPSRPDRAA